MKISMFRTMMCMACMQPAAGLAADADPLVEKTEAEQTITRAGTQAVSAGSSDYFTGTVRVEMVWPANEAINASGGKVTFEPGARSAWHTHPKGQHFVVIGGTGLTQEWGKPIQEIKEGDVIWCPPGVKHWHGAAATTAMTHIAVTGTENGKNVDWMEKVSDEQYSAQ